MLACVCATLALTTGVAQAAAEPHPHIGKLPGYPVIRGVVPVLGSKAAVSAHEKLVKGSFAAARTRLAGGLKATPVANEEFLSECVKESLFLSSQDVCYRGGPVLRHLKIHLIFWQGPVSGGVATTEHVETFSAAYIQTVERYFEDVVHDSGAQTNVFAVDPQYGDATGLGEYSFESADSEIRNEVFPSKCTDATEFSEGPCLLDLDIQKEVATVAAVKMGLKELYVVLTPAGVGGCFEASSKECAYEQYCAYHGDFGGDGMTPEGQTIYADLPFLGKVTGCDSGVHPNALTDNGADAVIDTASHEVNEAITDPIGSQCDEESKEIIGCEKNAWTDVIGQEVADKCLPPESTVSGIYGEPLGGSTASTFYNQLIDGHHYWTQREWSNEAGLFEGGCVQRAINASFTVSAGAQATVPMTLDGSGSGAPGDPATYWVWNFGGGEQVGTASPTISHTFAEAGEHLVALTAYDQYGNGEATVESFNVGPRAARRRRLLRLSSIKEQIVPGHLTAGQLATRLGLHVTKLSGNGPYSLGRAECPPACGVTLQLYAKVATAPGSRHTTKLVLIGSAHVTLAAKGAKKLVLSLNAKGKSLLRANRSLKCRLVVTVEGQEGGTWQIVRSLTLTR